MTSDLHENDKIEDARALRLARGLVLAKYYKISNEVLDKIIFSLIKDPTLYKIIAKQYKINPYILKTMLCYTRYAMSRSIANTLQDLNIKLTGLSVLDFGCLVADYGIFFARRGAKVTIYDHEKYINFAKFRFSREKLEVQTKILPPGGLVPHNLFAAKDIVIFGEVLEHLNNPLEILRLCISKKTKFIFTSKYPFGNAAYFSVSSHKKLAYLLQPACLELLRKKYCLKKKKIEKKIDICG